MITQRGFVNTILVYLLLFESGSQLGMLLGNKVLFVAFFIALIAWFHRTDGKISEEFLLYCIVFTGFLFALSLYTGGSLSMPSGIAVTMRLVLAYLVLRTVGASFADAYVKLVVFLAVISLFGYLSDTLLLFDGLVLKLPPVGEIGYEGVLYLFRHAWHPFRNNSIFFEPGAYQGFLNAALFIIFFTKTNYGNRQKWAYIIVLLAALVTTFSTTGFVIFALGFALFLYRSDILSFSGKLAMLGAIILSVGIFATEFHSAVVVKLSDYLDPQEASRGFSATGRSFDAQTDLKIFKRHVFGVGYKKYVEEFRNLSYTIGVASDAKDWGTSSNGVTSTFAKYGLPFSLFYFGSYYWALRKLLEDRVAANIAFVMFILFLWGESYFHIASISLAIIAGAFALDREALDKNTQRGAV